MMSYEYSFADVSTSDEQIKSIKETRMDDKKTDVLMEMNAQK